MGISKFTFASLFAGIGGFDFALERLGGACVFASEIDKFASKAYEALYGGTNLHGDITKIDAKDVPDHDVLTAGFPCQSFSVAGNRGGFNDARGTLFFEVARILAEKKPKVALLENVKGLVGHDKGKTLDTIVKALNECGYRVDFNVLNSKYFGVPQNRERIFIVAMREDLVDNEPWTYIKGNTVVPKGKRRISGYDDVKTFNFDWPEQGEVTTRLRDILETDVDERYYLSEEKTAKLVAQLEGREESTVNTGEPLATALQNGNMQGRRIKDAGDPSFTVSATDRHGIAEPQMLGHCDIKGHDAIKRTYSTEGISPTLTTMGGGHREPKIAEEQAQEVRATLTPDRITKRQNGRRFKEDGEESFTLTSQDRHGVAIGNYPRYRIRKLTPLECWRLQGFPDYAHEVVKDAGISDSQRYKQAGNAVTVNVIEALGTKLIPYLRA